ncbi:hypothetical protein LTS15_000185 [Exophiala xenobiotica]|nr:hypothetical protein LTS15_000185 [Exophiala xenobiotica]
MYMYLEAIYHVPLSVWMIWAIPNDHILVPLNLLIFALETAVTTLTCVVEMGSWTTYGYTTKEMNGLYALYLPYLALAALIGVDAYTRVRKQIMGSGPTVKGKNM